MDAVTILQLGSPPAASERLIGIALGVLIGGLAFYVSGRFLADTQGYDHAVLTAVIGALVWALLAPVPLFGPVIALVGWIAILKWRYPVGWFRATAVGVAAWAAAVVLVAALQLFGVHSVSAIGVPGA